MDDIFEVAEFWYQPVDWKGPYRYVVTRKHKKNLKGQALLFSHLKYTYHVMVTNRNQDKIQLMRNHHGRGGVILKISSKEYKEAMGAGHLPSSKFMSNYAYMVLSAMAMTVMQILIMKAEDRSCWAKRLRFKWLFVPMKLIHHVCKW